jgi:hypothetical protein
VATWSLGNRFSICLKTRGNQEKPCRGGRSPPNYYKPLDLTYKLYSLPIKHTQNVPPRNDQTSEACSKNHLKQKCIQQYRQCTHERITEARSCNHRCSGNAVNITYCECACTLGSQHTKALAPYCQLWPAPLYNIFPYYLTNGKIF